MPKIYKNLRLDTMDAGDRIVLTAKQNDAESRFLLVTFTASGNTIMLSESDTVQLNITMPDGGKLHTLGSVTSDGKAAIELVSDVCAIPGILLCDITVTGTDSSRLSCMSFEIEVEKSNFDSGAAEAHNDFPLFTQAIVQMAQIESTIESAETARQVYEEYDSAKAYVKGNKVAYDGESYAAVSEAPVGSIPGENAAWLLIAGKGSVGEPGKPGVLKFTSAGTGTAYTAEIEGYTEYKPGDLFVMIPHANMTGEPCTLNINELGAKTLRRLCGDMASGSIPVAEPAFIIAGVPIRLMYKPDCFILLDRPQALGGNDFADAVSVGKGGTGKTAWSTNRLVYASASNALAQVAQPDGERLLGQNSSGEPYWVEVDATADFFSTNPVQSNAVAELSNQLAVHKQYNLVPGDRGAHGLKYDVVGNKFQYSTNDYNWTDIVLGGGGSYKKIGYTDDCDYVVSSSSGGKAVFDTAISAASDGDIIMVMDGIYGYPYGSTGAAKRVTISKNITFISGGGSRPTISFDVYVDGNLDTGASYKLTVKDIDFTGSVSTYGDTNYEQYQSCDSTIYAFNCSFGNAIIHGMFHGCVFGGSISDPGNSFSVGHIFNDCKFNNTTISMSGGMMSTSFINCTFNSGSNAISISAFGLTFNNCFFYSNVTGSVICDTNGASYDMLCDCKVFGVPLTLPDGCSTRSYQFSGTAI